MADQDNEHGAAPLERRTFLGLVGGAASVLVSGCGDDGIAADGGGSSSGSSGGTADDGVGESADDGGTDSTTAPSDGDGTTSDTGDTSVDGESDGSSGTTGEPEPVCEEDGAFEEEWSAPGLTEDTTTFPLAVLAGEMRPTSIMLACYIDDAAPKIVRVWRAGSKAGTVLVVAEVEVQPTADGYAKATIDGLCPGTWYFYTWLIGEPGNFTARSAIGQVRTAIADDALEPLTLAISACNGDDFDWPALEVTADEPYDMFLHLGDMAYNDGSTTLQQYRESWREYLSTQGMRLAFGRSGLYATWDDHEIDDNSNFDRETMDPGQLQKRQNAMDAYFELLPIDATGPDYVLWRSFRWGLTAEIFVLDCRYERRPSMGQYISPAQMEWLQDALSSSPCQFKIVMNSVPITNMPFVWDVAANDRWEGYPDQRDELMAFLEGIENVYFVSGDFHVCFVSTLEPAPATSAEGIYEIAVTGGNSNILGDFLGAPQFMYGTSAARGCLLTLDPDTNSVNVRYIDPSTGMDAFNTDLSYD